MSELLRLRDALFQSNQIDSRTTYQRKLDIIQENLYGVDNDEFAVNIAMLRLWLSLAVDYEGNEPEPLPNLDYKVAIGDSVTGPAPEPPDGQLRSEDSLIQQIQEHTANYQLPTPIRKNSNFEKRLLNSNAASKGGAQTKMSLSGRLSFQKYFKKVDLILSSVTLLMCDRNLSEQLDQF